MGLRRAFLLPALAMVFASLFSNVSAQGVFQSYAVASELAVVYDENASGFADMAGDTWVFDRDQNGGADLIIRFRQEPQLTAYIYDDISGNRQVDYLIDADGVNILEQFWRVKAVARNGSWALPDGKPDWNLDLAFDTGFEVVSGVDQIPLAACPLPYKPHALALTNALGNVLHGNHSINGDEDLHYRYWDHNLDGVPDLEWRDADAAGSYDAISVNASAYRLYVVPHLFPLLDTVLLIRWQDARISHVRGLIPFRSNESGYFILLNQYSAEKPIKHGFENPFAYYDLAGDQDCVSELKLRTVVEDFDRDHPELAAYNEIRYSWMQTGNYVQYRFYLIGRQWIDTLVPYPFYSISHIPYAELPSFVLDHKWRGAIFGEAETPLPADTEGLYENLNYTTNLRALLLSNRSRELPRYLPFYKNLREEYNFIDYNRKPQVYFSAVDQRLHMLGAQHGILIYDAKPPTETSSSFDAEYLKDGTLPIYSSVEYEDGDGDGYVDAWTRLEMDMPVMRLIVRPGAAALIGNNSLRLKRLPADYAFVTWHADPPDTAAEWNAFNEALIPFQQTRRILGDLESIFNDLPGDAVALSGVTYESVSAQPQRLLLHIQADGSGNLPQGEYVLRGEPNDFVYEAAALPNVEIASFQLNGDRLSAEIKNSANVDVPVSVVMKDNHAYSVELLREERVVPAQGSITYDLPWSPPSGGDHTLAMSAAYSAGDQEQMARAEFQASSVDQVDQDSIFQLQSPRFALITALGLVLIFLLAGGLWAVVSDWSAAV
jgi:hypothetical protein